MEYRYLGKSGLRLSELSFGSWVTFGKQVDLKSAVEMMAEAYDSGVNFFDNAEAYAGGQSEEIMGKALRKLGWPRGSYLVSTKFFWGLNDGVNQSNTLNRKYLLEAIGGSLRRFGLDYVDLLYCHRDDPETPVGEVVWAMHDIIERGQALYWGTSEWEAARIIEAIDFAERHHLHAPVVEQPQYNLFQRVWPGLRRRVQGAWLWLDGLEPFGVGASDRQVPRRHSGGQPRSARNHALDAGPPDRPGASRTGCGPGADCRGHGRQRSSHWPGACKTRT